MGSDPISSAIGIGTNLLGGALGGDDGGASQTTSQTTTPYQQEYFDKLLGGATDLFEGEGFFDTQYGGGQETRAAWDAGQQDLFNRIQGGALQSALSGLETTLGPYDPNNPALTAAIDMAGGDITRNLQEQLLPSIGDTAGQAGQFGSTRHGIAEGLALRSANEQLGDVATQMRLQDMQSWQGNQQNAIQNLGNLMQGLEYTAGGAQREKQAMLDDLFSKWEYESGIDLKNLQAYKQLISGDMGGSQTGSAEAGGGDEGKF